MDRVPLRIAAAPLLLLGACRGGGDGPAGPPAGTIEVTAATTGTPVDPDGYAVSVDGGAGAGLAVGGTVFVAEVSEGQHTVALGDLAANCRTGAGTNPRTVAVSAGDTTQVSFAVTCGGTPTATTLPATEETERTMVLNGIINPDGWSTRWIFEVGTTNALGGQCGEGVEFLTGTSEEKVSCIVIGQPPGGTVYYRLVAENGAGRAAGEILSATTVPGRRGTPPTVTAVEFPPEISITGGGGAEGTVRFADADGDVVHAFFEEVSDPSDAFGGDTDFPLDLLGVRAGSFTFGLSCGGSTPCTAGTITVRLSLEDAVGNRSEPVEFTWTQR